MCSGKSSLEPCILNVALIIQTKVKSNLNVEASELKCSLQFSNLTSVKDDSLSIPFESDGLPSVSFIKKNVMRVAAGFS